MKVPVYESNIAFNPQQLQTPPVRHANENANLSSQYEEQAKLGETIHQKSKEIFDFIEKKNERDAHFQMMEEGNKYLTDLQNLLYNPNRDKFDRPIGLMNREGKDAFNIGIDYDQESNKIGEEYLKRADSQQKKELLTTFINTHKSQFRDGVFRHEAAQIRSYQEGVFKNYTDNTILSAANTYDPAKLSGIMDSYGKFSTQYHNQLGVYDKDVIGNANKKVNDAIAKSSISALLNRESNPLFGTNWGQAKNILEKIKDKISPAMYEELNDATNGKRFFDFQLNTWNGIKDNAQFKVGGNPKKHAGYNLEVVKDYVFRINSMDKSPLTTENKEHLWKYIEGQIREEQSINISITENAHREALNIFAKWQAINAQDGSQATLQWAHKQIEQGKVPYKDEYDKLKLHGDLDDTYMDNKRDGDSYTIDDISDTIISGNPDVVYKIRDARDKHLITPKEAFAMLKTNKELNENPDKKAAFEEAREIAKEKYDKDNLEDRGKFIRTLMFKSQGKTGDEIRNITKNLLTTVDSGHWWIKDKEKWTYQIEAIDALSTGWGNAIDKIGKSNVEAIKLGYVQTLPESMKKEGMKIKVGVDVIDNFANAFGGYDALKPGTEVSDAIAALKRRNKWVTVGNVKALLEWKRKQNQ